MEHRRFGAAEAVDRLFEVADEEQAASVEAGAAKFRDKVRLQLVRVLKFIDEQQAELVGQPRAELHVLRMVDQVECFGEEIVEIEFALGPLLVVVNRGDFRRKM